MRRRIIFAIVIIAAFVRKLLMSNDLAYKALFLPGMGGFRTVMGKWKAWYTFAVAMRRCPAYADYVALNGNGGPRLNGWSWVPDFSSVPEMDKARYIKAYRMPAVCLGGKLPTRGAVIDQSSGSTGKPQCWVRGDEERRTVARIMQIALRELVGRKKNILFVNAFALGPWATGMFVSYSVSDECLLISVGPDADKIITTMKDFGSDDFLYVIAGYPPFLKMLVDNPAIDWKEYEAIAFYGGEGMSEAMRGYLQGAFKQVYGDYGASDLEINIGAESDFSIALRRVMASNEKVRRRLNEPLSSLQSIQDSGRKLEDALPHIFQYNQLDYLIESNQDGELLVTICRSTNVSPRVRYNIHDHGHVMSYDELLRILREEGVDINSLPPAIAPMPLMFLYGRSDLAVSYYGCKIPPTDIEKVLFEMPAFARTVSSFRLITREDELHDKHLTLAIELAAGAAKPDDLAALKEAIFSALMRTNQDFREASRIAAQKNVEAELEVHGFREGPFVGSDIRTKYKYIDEQ